ncbi:MAG: polyphosphate kinase 1, partial [Gemmatimonadetes bacterium]|nr:polyphosphate kinase 1 [Gemmatimonadota bacterium]
MLRRSPVVRVTLYYVIAIGAAVALLELFPALGIHFSPDPTRLVPDLDQLRAALGQGARGAQAASVTPLEAVFSILGALVLSVPVAWVYMLTKEDVKYDESVPHTVIILPLVVAGIVLIVRDSVALAFSLAGVVAAVRFRNTLRDTKDAVYIFLAVGIGLAAGVQALVVALILSSIFNIVVFVLWKLESAQVLRHTAEFPVVIAESLPAAGGPSRGSMTIDTKDLLARAPELKPGGLEPVINPELSWLEFNARVLALAEDPATPLLARLRFLAIFTTNLDEFFMTKVGGLKQAVAAGVTKRSIDGRSPRELLLGLNPRLRALLRRQYRCFAELCEGELRRNGVRIRGWPDLGESERAQLKAYFDEQVFPVLTPKAITTAPGHPFPHIEDLRLSLAVVVRDPRTDREHLNVLNVSDALPRFVRLKDTRDFVPIEDVIRAYGGALYRGRTVLGIHAFRLTRSGEVQFEEQTAANFLEVVEEEVRRRPFGAIIRVEVERGMPESVLDVLLGELRHSETQDGLPLEAGDVFEVDGPVDLGALAEIAELEIPELDYPPFAPVVPLDRHRAIFDVLDERDVLVHHPYESFEDTVQRFLSDAADDPDVVTIKLTLYRAGGRSPVVEALKRAAAAGKEVSVFVEIKARFDEETNIFWAKQLERAGIHTITGLVALKTHAKVALVVRRRGERLQRYAHIGTGNYNAATAHVYTDFGLLTSDPTISADLQALFNELTGSSRAPVGEFQRLLVAPTFMLRRFLELIEREAAHARAGRGGHIRVKLNGLADTEVIEALYRASQAGVRIELSVRAICALRPGIRGLSDNIRVVSVLGRFLEHGRLYCFGNGGDVEYYIGSADWRSRNLRRRVEVVTPVLDPALKTRLDRVLEAELNDPAAWRLLPDGSYERPTGARGPGVQEQLLQA